jgi:peptidoglycan hydrolase CwlO-like protein
MMGFQLWENKTVAIRDGNGNGNGNKAWMSWMLAVLLLIVSGLTTVAWNSVTTTQTTFASKLAAVENDKNALETKVAVMQTQYDNFKATLDRIEATSNENNQRLQIIQGLMSRSTTRYNELAKEYEAALSSLPRKK